MGVVGCNQRDARFPCKADQKRQHLLLLLQAVILYLNVVIALPEQIVIIKGRVFRFFVVARQEGLGDLARKARRKAHQTLVVLLQHLFINPGLGIKALDEARGHQLDQVFVAGFILAQQHQMVRAVDPVHLVEPGAGSHIDLAADDRLNACLFGCLVKIHTAIHCAMIGNGNGGLPQLLHPVENFIDPAGAVQQAVFGMDMKVCKVFLLFSHWISFVSCSLRSAQAFSGGVKARIC